MSPTKISTPWNACSWDATEQPQAAGIAIKYKIAKMDMKFDTDAMRGAGLAVFVMTLHAGSKAEEELCTSSYDGQVLFQGSILGRTGTVTIHESGTTTNGDVEGEWVIATGSATGDLKGIKGRGGYKMKAGNGDKPIFGELQVDLQ